MTTRHEQKTATVDDRTAEVDADLVPLIEAVWRLNIDTVMSCQDNPGNEAGLDPVRRVWLCLVSDDGEPFLQALFPANLVTTDALPHATEDGDTLSDEEVDGFRNRVLPQWDQKDWVPHRRDRVWHYSVSVNDYGEFGSQAFPTLLFSVRFPFTDMAEVVRRLDIAYAER